MKLLKKRAISLLLAVVLLVGMMPMTVLASNEIEENLWKGRSAVFVGDSITVGSGTTKTYYQYLNETLGFGSVTAMGVAGSCISAASDYGQANQPLINRYQDIPSADLILVFMGTNDYGHETPLGTMDDTQDDTFYGALNVIIATLVEKHPSSKIVFVTPLHRYGFGTSKILGTQFTSDSVPNGVGATLGDYVEALKTVCANNGVSVIDLYTECTLDPSEATVRANYIPDGLHPNVAGHELIAGIMESHIRSYLPVVEAPKAETELVYGNKFASGFSQQNRASSCVNKYLKAGTTITLKDPDVFQWACTKTSDENSCNNLGYFPDGSWSDKETAVVTADGWVGFVFKYRDEAQTFDLTKPLSDYITIEVPHNYENGICTDCGEVDPNLTNYKGKVISILGDSISTFAGYIPTADGFNLEHLARYPQDNLLTDVNETWWMQVIHELDAKLGINDSWRGATVSGAKPVTTGTTGENASMANLTRIQNLGSNGTPDVILFYGGTNDLAHVSKVGVFNPDDAPDTVDLVTTKWDNLVDGYANTILRLQYFYPDAQIICLLPTYTTTYYSNDKLAQGNEVLAEICKHYGVTYADLRYCGMTTADLPDGIHPGATGMDYITEMVLETLSANCDVEAGENIVYFVTHELNNAESSLGYYKGISLGEAFSTMIQGEELAVSVTMGGEDITDAVYANGIITIPAVTGNLVIKATGKQKLVYTDHLQQLPDFVCSETNLWTLLEHDKEYYTASGWGVHSSGKVRSVTIPIFAGNRIWATSFQASGINGSTMNGIRLTWFDETGVLESVSADKVYEEFSLNGYLTAPEGAVAVNVVMWNGDDSNELYILNRDHVYENGVCIGCGALAPLLEGKNISILGASISTYVGISNNTDYNSTIGSNAVYYTEGRYGVYANDTWWMQVANDLGLELLVNNSWSGSSLLHERNGTVGAYVDRCVQLHNNDGEEPDIIAIQMGTNDFQYYKDTLGTADIDYDALINLNDDGSYTYAEPSTSLEAAAIVLHKIAVRYPNAEVYYLNISQRVDGTDALIQSFNAELKQVVEHFGAHIVDIYGSAITMGEFDAYIGDGRVHPNKLGMDAYTEAFKRSLIANTEYKIDTHTVSFELDGVTADYGDDKIVVDGDSFTVKLTSADDMNVSVTMGGKDITADAYASGVVSIDAVTEDVTIFVEYTHTPQDYRWEFNGTDLICVDGDNTLTKNAGTTLEGVFTNTKYALEKAVVLQHDKPWVVEWKCEGTFQNSGSSSGARLFTSTDVNAEYNARYVFKSNKNGLIAMGEKTTTGSHNYGIALGDYGIDWAKMHTYRLENRIDADGSNMVYLFVDGVELGAMNHYYVGTTDKNTTSDWLAGKDFIFPYMGTDTHGFTNASIEYIQIMEEGHSHSYEDGVCTGCGAAQWDIDGDGTLEILAIGNSFSVDALEYAYQIAQDLSIEKIAIGNLYIGGCSLATHAANAAGDLAKYTYYYNDNGKWVSTNNYKISTALDSRSWDYISMQQASDYSGVENSYNEDLTELITYVQKRSNAKLVWHMTWAYQQNSTHSAFPTYDKDQMTMYNAIVSSVQNQIVTNDSFDLIIPNGTAVQNSRTSLLGDTTTRDGYHMSYDYGRYLTGLLFVKTVTGLPVDHVTYRPTGVDEMEQKIAIESVNNAAVTPFTITKSAFTGEIPTDAYVELQTELFKGAFWYPINADNYNNLVYDMSNSHQYFATIRFTRDTLPVGSIIMLEESWQYRPDGWISDTVQTGTREPVTTQRYVVITEEWWGDYTIRAFNISKVGLPSMANVNEEEVRAAFRIYIPEECHVHEFEDGKCILCGKANGPIITRQPADGEAKFGERYMVEVLAEGKELKYQWYFRNAGSDKWYKSGVKDNTYDDVMTKARSGREVYCVITDANGNKVTTDTVKLIAMPSEKLEIVTQPTNGEAVLGEHYCVTVEAKGEGLKYQWYFRNKGATSWTKSSVTDNTYDDVMTTARAEREVYCVVIDALGNKVTTDIVKLVRVPIKLEIATQPVDVASPFGEKFCATVEAKGEGLKYQWYYRNAGTDTWHKSGVRDNTYDDIMTKARNGREIYCVITDAYGNTVITDIVKLIAVPSVELKLLGQTYESAAMGERYCLTVNVQGEGVKYQWYFRNAGSDKWYKSGVKDNTYDDVMTKARANRDVYCVITDALGNQVKTEVVTLTVEK